MSSHNYSLNGKKIMDLVDIDQVLDNLELREAADENNKAAIERNRLLSQADVEECGSSECVASAASASSTHSALVKASSSGVSINKGFVGVSQVFNSLDDYCKNVEGLETVSQQKYDEECRLINNSYASDATKSDSKIKVVHDNLDDESEQGNKEAVFANSPETPLSTVIIDGRQQKNEQRFPDDEEEEATNDIHKFIENSGTRLSNNFNDVDDATTVSDSLTTSSSSTFSSGPSPGLESITDEQSPLSPVDDEFENENAKLTVANKQNEKARVENNASELSNDVISSQPEESVVALDDLAAGLSSISITTANSQLNVPCEASISSVLQNVLEDLSETTTTSLLSQLRDDCVIAEQQKSLIDSRTFPSISPSYPEEKFDDNEKHLAANENTTKVPCLETNQFASKHQQQQPITFGSTMDEISDTELDSMLQEMDIDDITAENNQPASKPNITSNQVVESVTIMQKSSHTGKTSAISDSVENSLDGSNLGDCLNADSFSQASTVEFSEIRAQTLQPPSATDIGQSSNSIVSSYTSSESSLDGDVMQLAESVAGEGEEVEYLDAHSNVRPQRPTTLALPKVKTTLYANAGQTPLEVNDTQENMKSTEKVPENELPVVDSNTTATDNEIAEATGYSDPHANLGKIPPIWVPDNMATGCMQCQTKFTMIKRRHHCRACGKVLCSVCCSQKFKLEFLNNSESRVCVQCFLILSQLDPEPGIKTTSGAEEEVIGVVNDGDVTVASASAAPRSPNPNNPMEYCSTIPPHRQVSDVSSAQVPSVIVPVGVLKKDGSYSSNSSNSSSKQGRKRKSVMFSDGIAPGSDLASMEHQWSEAKHARRGHHQSEKTRNAGSNKSPTPVKSQPNSDATTIGLVAQLFRGSIPPMAAAAAISTAQGSNGLTSSKTVRVLDTEITGNQSTALKADSVPIRSKRLPPSGCDEYGSFIPKGDCCLPPICLTKDQNSCDFEYMEVTNNYELMQRLQRETLKFAVQKNFFVYVKIVNLQCCMNRTVINFTTYGMHHVGNDELIILLEFETPASKELMLEPPIPNDIFIHLQEIYTEAAVGHPIAELSYTSPRQSKFLGSRDYGGFIFIRATFQCLQDVIAPENPFLIGILIHRYEVPWAKVFPLRLMLRLGAQYRYYPCPHISMRNRQSVYAEIAQTIINFLADFRNYSYTLPCIRGMYIHMEDRQTTVLIPRNRLEDVIKAINNSSDHILAFGGNFSKTADGHLVCMQNVNDDRTEMYAYSTQAINIQGQPRKVTGASFFVLNEALKSTSGLSGKCSIVEDGLMVQILPSKMEEVRNSLRNQKDINIVCGPVDADEQQTEIVTIKWMGNDRDFNIGVISPIDKKSMEGVSSMRVNANFNYSNANYSIRLTDIYIIKYEEWYNALPAALAATSLEVTRIAEQLARSASMALVPFLDLLAASGNSKIALRATLHQDIVCYEAGARGTKLPPLYMNALDSHLIPTLHNESASIEESIILELIFYILNV